MTTTATAVQTLKTELTKADPNRLADELRKVDLGALLTVQEINTGTISAVAAVPIPGGALFVQSARVVASGTGASLGTYIASDSADTPLLPPGGASLAPGIASLNAAGTTITFPNTVTQAVIRYIKKPATDLTAKFAAST